MTRLLLALTLLAATQTPTASQHFRQGDTAYVGIHYWLQREDGSRLTEAQAQPGTQYSIHLENNVAGFLTVFLTIDGSELTPLSDRYGGLHMPSGDRFTLPGKYRLAPAGSSDRLVFLFARSQTEIVRTSAQALEKLARIRERVGTFGPSLISETISEGVALGTYVVNRSGAQPSGTIGLTR